MRKFCLKFSILLVIFITIISGLFFIVSEIPISNEDFAGAIVDKHKLLQEADRKKMVFISGSNLIYGLDSSKIEEKTDYDVVNAALTFGVGLNFMLKDIELYLKPQDIVVIAPEYNHFTADVNGDETVNYLLAEFLPNSYSSLDINQWDKFIKNLPKYFESKLRLLNSLVKTGKIDVSPYLYRSGFDNNGDLVAHLDYPQPDTSTIPLSSESLNVFNEEAFKVINDFAEFCKENDVKVYMTYPVLYDKQYELWENNIEKLHEKIKKELNVEVISTPESYVFEEKYMFDSVYHLNKDGRELRTDKIIDDLRQYDIIK